MGGERHCTLPYPLLEWSRAWICAYGFDRVVRGYYILYIINMCRAEVPGTDIIQLFLFDCDGNGVELGNFAALPPFINGAQVTASL
jgi:hypothetical protein